MVLPFKMSGISARETVKPEGGLSLRDGHPATQDLYTSSSSGFAKAGRKCLYGKILLGLISSVNLPGLLQLEQPGV